MQNIDSFEQSLSQFLDRPGSVGAQLHRPGSAGAQLHGVDTAPCGSAQVGDSPAVVALDRNAVASPPEPSSMASLVAEAAFASLGSEE